MARKRRRRKSGSVKARHCRTVKQYVAVKVGSRRLRMRDDSMGTVTICPVGKGYRIMGPNGLVGKPLRKG